MSYLYNEDTINEVKDKNDIVDTISKYIDLKRIGSNYKGLCPFHNEKTPSFTVSEEKQIFHCFGCGEGGDVFSFIMKQENIEFVDALKILADNANIELKRNNVNPELEKSKNILLEINREAARHFYRNLFNNRVAYDYLLNRGINKDVIKTFGIGYSIDSWNNLLDFLKDKGYEEKDVEKAGLITYHKKTDRYFDKFRGRIIFPIINIRGDIIGFGGRSIDSKNQPKYLNSPETQVFSKGNNLYALNVAKNYNKNQNIILVEGYMDVVSLYKYGIKNSVASLGTALTENQVNLLKRYSREIYICFDSDNAGKKATDKAIDVMKNMNISPRIINLPENLDPDDFIKKFGLSDFNKLINKSMTSIDFKINQKKSKYDINNYEGKINFIKDLSTLLKSIKSPVEREVYIEKVAKETNINSQIIKQEIGSEFVIKNNSLPNKYKFNNKENITPVRNFLKPAHLTAEKELLNLIINNKNIYLNLKDKVFAKDFLEPISRKLAEIVYDFYEDNKKIDFLEVIEYFEKDELEIVKKIFSLDIKVNDNAKAIEDYIKNINYYKINMKKEDIKRQLKKIDNKDIKTDEDLELFNKLCLELIEIDKRLKIN